MNRFIRFPEAQKWQSISHKFHAKRGFPGVIGCVDGAHIPVLVPKSDRSETYRNRKGFMSLNVQMVCGPKEEIYDIVAGWPGSAHDAVIWTTSDISSRMSDGMLSRNFHLLGDSAYPLSSYLLTPFKSPTSRAESNFSFTYFLKIQRFTITNTLPQECA